VRFENVADGQVNAAASGIEAFRRLAEQGSQLFSESANVQLTRSWFWLSAPVAAVKPA
jgi:hypothetical protein